MKPYQLILVVSGLSGQLLFGEDAKAPVDNDGFERTRRQISELFQRRDDPPLRPVDLRNPFLSDSGRSVSTANPTPNITGSARGILEAVTPNLQIRGIVETAGRFGIIFNRKIYYEGDTLAVPFGETSVEVRVRRITSATYTVGYGDAEITLRLSN